MITEERLKELIEQGATVWAVNFYNKDIEKLELNSNLDAVNAGEFMKYDIKQYYYFHYSFESLFETEEDAKWELEFGNITRTEILNLPTWEEIEKEVGNYGTYIIEFNSENKSDECTLCINATNKKIIVVGYKSWELTKENYIDACRLCKKLFLGEQV